MDTRNPIDREALRRLDQALTDGDASTMRREGEALLENLLRRTEALEAERQRLQAALNLARHPHLDGEPLIHSHITDGLPDGHPLVGENVNCQRCGALIHAEHNECMQTWVETGKGVWCLNCLAELTDGVLEDDLRLSP